MTDNGAQDQTPTKTGGVEYRVTAEGVEKAFGDNKVL